MAGSDGEGGTGRPHDGASAKIMTGNSGYFVLGAAEIAF